jgi:ligand-binding SRPBCC domain-containing protein
MERSHSLFERSVPLAASPAEVYAFHEDPRNIGEISPPSLRVERVECSVPARPGEEFRLLVSQFGLPLEWVGYWDEAKPFSRLVDGARKSPFRHWRHHHLFEPMQGGTLMTDRVEYELPFGLLGRLLDRTVMRLVFAAMFAARHRATRKFFEKRKTSVN